MAQKVISFRIDAAHFDLLVQRAGADSSPGASARELVIRALNDQRLSDELEARLRALGEEQGRLRQDLRRLLEAIIVTGGRVSPTEAKEHVKRILG